MSKPTVGIFGLTGCAGDQLVILNCEDRLLELASLIDVRDFLMATSANDTGCPLDIALVEGAVLSNRDAERLQKIRQRARILVALGTCAVWGGVAAMDSGADRSQLLREIYGEIGLGYDSIAAQALDQSVKVDLKITGCPIEEKHFLAAIANLLNGDPPVYPAYPVCTECRMAENNCLLIERGEICCGPITAAGCNARCPEWGVPCVGCRGPASDANPSSFLAAFEERGIAREAVAGRLKTFAPRGVQS